MRITISGKNLDITEGLRSAVEEKLSRLEKYFTPDTIVNVTLSVTKKRHQKMEVTIPEKDSLEEASKHSLKNTVKSWSASSRARGALSRNLLIPSLLRRKKFRLSVPKNLE